MKILLLLGLILCLGASTFVSAQKHRQTHEAETAEAERPAVDARSFMELFTKLERDWILAVQHGDKLALDDILAPEFILRTSGDPEHPVVRSNWIQDALSNFKVRSFSHRSMAIRAFTSNAIVTFVQSQQATIDGKDSSGDYFVVDLWVVNHGSWQVAARYIAPIAKQLAVHKNN